MISRLIELSVRNRAVVLLLTLGVSLWGVYCLYRTPVDAIPDLSENQVIVWADWMGRSPQEVEDQITYPLSVNLQGLAGVKSVRASSEFGFSMVIIIFDEHVGYYFARERVLERLSIAGSFLPPGVVPYLAPDATALGQVFWYVVEGEGKSLDELRAIQDWYVRYQLGSVAGVAQVASAGGFVREFQVDVDPDKLRSFGVTLGQVFDAVMSANSSVGGKVIQKGGAEYIVRGYGWVKGLEDIRQVVVAEREGVPITVERLAAVQLGPAFRRGVLEKDGREAVGGVVMIRYGENPLAVTERIKEKIRDLQPGLPEGVRIAPFYDRTGLIHASIHTLTRTLIEEITVASLVVFLVLWHVRSAVVICVTLPLAVLISFIFMYHLGIPSNIMSLSGIAISVGVLVDAGIVMTENAYNRLHEHFAVGPMRSTDGRVRGDTREIVIEACKVVGGPVFFSIVIMLLSFMPVFVLGGLEGKMFNPLAYTKSFALLGVSLLAVTLVPALVPTFVRGRLRSQQEVWLVRSFAEIYKPMLEFFLRHPDAIVVITGIFLLAGLPVFPPKVPWIFFVAAAPFIIGISTMLVARRKVLCFAVLFVAALASFRSLSPLGETFMPPLDEQSILDMPITAPSVNITQASDDLKDRDAVLRGFPEVHQVVGKLGRAETPTDPAPIDMVETIVTLRPKEHWPRRKVNYSDVEAETRAVVAALLARGVLKHGEASDLAALAEASVVEAETPAVAAALLARSRLKVEASGGPDALARASAMDAAVAFDRDMRELSVRRLRELAPEKGRRLAKALHAGVVSLLERKGKLKGGLDEARSASMVEHLAAKWWRAFDEQVLLEDVTRAAGDQVELLASSGLVDKGPDLLADEPGPAERALAPLLALLGERRRTFFETLRDSLDAEAAAATVQRVKQLDLEIEERAPGTLAWRAIEAVVDHARRAGTLSTEPDAGAMKSLRATREQSLAQTLALWPKLKSDITQEMHSDLQVPGWTNIFTQPIINRVDMLSTGVRTMIGVKVFGKTLEQVQDVSNEVAAVLKGVRGAVEVFPDQVTGENYLQIEVDRQAAARYGVRVQDIQDVIEVALGGKEITLVVDGRERFPVRVRYPRDWREDEESVKAILVPAGAAAESPAPAMSGPSPPKQVPLSLVAKVFVVPGPSMIKSENGLLRSYVQLNVRGRDVVGFVDEARRSVADAVKLPQGSYLEWSGQFEHQERAQRTLTVILPAVILIIFVILYMTYGDFADTLMMFLAVPGAIAGGALFQAIFGYEFSVAVWVGYIACFGLATSTGIVMLVYLREAIDKRGGLERIGSEEEIKDAVMDGAVHRLRPKLLTEGTTILALIPMLWATGVGSELMRPMAAPILGGILVADEVIDILIPVLFYWERCRRWRRRRGSDDQQLA